MEVTIVIPSYQRPVSIVSKTLATLERGAVPKNRIYIFVANQQELLAYQEHVQGYHLVVGVPGLINQRKFISSYFQENDYIVSLDDDIERIYKAIDTKTKEDFPLIQFFQEAFQRMEQEGVSIWGIYPVDNPYFAFERPEVTTSFTYLVGAMYGYKNKDIPTLDYVDGLEDKERSILYYLKEGKTLRFNHICMKTKYFSDGGIQSGDERKQSHYVAANAMAAKYPGMVTVKTRKNGYSDLLFNFRYEKLLQKK